MAIKQVLLYVQDLLVNPNFEDPARQEPVNLYHGSKDQYEQRIRLEAQKNRM